MPNNNLRTFKILKGEKIIIRRRFPNFVCDGRPLGPEPELYVHTIILEEDFYNLDWVREISEDPDFIKWYLHDNNVCAEYTTGPAWHAVVEEGEINFDTR